MVNKNGKYKNHAHVNKKDTAYLLVKLIKRKTVPNSDYLRESAKRITLDKRYKKEIDIKIEKDKNKQHYVNINKGAIR